MFQFYLKDEYVEVFVDPLLLGRSEKQWVKGKYDKWEGGHRIQVLNKDGNSLGYVRVSNERVRLPIADFQIMEIRAAPQDDGTILYIGIGDWEVGDNRCRISPEKAFACLLEDGVLLTIALNDPVDKGSHWETTAPKFRKI